jgi:hypothetical protein
MWRLTTCYNQENNPFLTSTNEHQGRQVWVFDKEAGSDEDRREISSLREAFTANRLTQKHSSDELLRKQMRPKLKVQHNSCLSSRAHVGNAMVNRLSADLAQPDVAARICTWPSLRAEITAAKTLVWQFLEAARCLKKCRCYVMC